MPPKTKFNIKLGCQRNIWIKSISSQVRNNSSQIKPLTSSAISHQGRKGLIKSRCQFWLKRLLVCLTSTRATIYPGQVLSTLRNRRNRRIPSSSGFRLTGLVQMAVCSFRRRKSTLRLLKLQKTESLTLSFETHRIVPFTATSK
jgi:hypothetical protein